MNVPKKKNRESGFIKMNKINDSSLVITHNDLNKISFPGFERKELDFLYGAIIALYNNSDKKVKISFDDMLESVGLDYKRKTETDLAPWINSFTTKAAQVICPMFIVDKKDGAMFAKLPFFGSIVFSFDSQYIEFQANPKFEYMLQQQKSKYTAFTFGEFKNLDRKYSKLLFRLLSQWKTVGSVTFEIEELKRLLDVPASCDKISRLRSSVLFPAVKELQTKFPDLNFTTVKNKNKVIAYKFTWDKIYFENLKKKEISDKKKQNKNTEIIVASTPYSNNFKNGYIPGENAPTAGFSNWLEYVNFLSINNEYFDMRTTAKDDLISSYKKKVIDGNSSAWTDMRFFAAVYSVVLSDKAMTNWNIEDAYSEIRKGKPLDIPQEVYNSLPEDKGLQLQAFARNGKAI